MRKEQRQIFLKEEKCQSITLLIHRERKIKGGPYQVKTFFKKASFSEEMESKTVTLGR